MRALTLRNPWAAAVVELNKDVENRVWSTGYRGLIAVHAGRSLDADAPASVGQALRRRLVSGCVIAVAQLRDVVRNSESEWARQGEYHWLLEGVRALVVPVPCQGRQGLFHLPPAVEVEVMAALAPAHGHD